MKYNVGDRVKVRGVKDHRCAYNGKVVTIGSINPNNKWAGNINPHYGVDSSIFIFFENELSPVNDQKIVITTDGMETLARLYEDNKVIKTATARCAPGDTFDFTTGAKLAFERLMGEAKETKENVEFVPHLTFKGKNFGNIGEPTNYKDAIGRPLYVGDIVEHFGGTCKSFGDTVIVKSKFRSSKGKAFVMGLEIVCDDENGTTGNWKILKKRSFDEVKNGEIVNFVKYVKEI